MMRHITLISAHVAGERPPTSPPALPPQPCNRPPPRSCDTFVALPPATADGSVVFGKNSDRECKEVQEVVAIGGSQHPEGAQLRCTYITIPQAPATLAVVLSKPSWMWGAEMGANEAGVVCGNEAVWTVEDSEGPRALLGMDLVRLGLERGATAAQAVDVITELLERHGQGGPCEEAGTWTYHNSFLLADPSEAWVLETAGKCWAARRITQGVFNISNCLSIRTVFHRSSPGLQAYAQQKGLWDGQCEFDFAAAFSDGGAPPLGQLTAGREANGHRLLQAAAGKLDPSAIMAILRDSSSGICMRDGSFRSNGSQVSRLARSTGGGSDSSAGQQHQHWFTATPDPQRSVYKPFAFPPASSSSGGSLRQQQPECSPHTAASPAARNPPHPLWQAWQAMHEYFGTLLPPQASLQLRELEAQGLDPQADLTFAVAVQREMQLYGAAV